MHMTDEFNEELHMQSSATPESIAIAGDDRERLKQALDTLPPRFREVLVLRELEGCPYKEIAEITSTPMGTVMSSLSRAGRQLQSAMAKHGRRRTYAWAVISTMPSFTAISTVS